MTRRVLIHRANQPDFWQTEGLYCPSCHQPTRREFEQPDMLRAGVTHTKTDCQNPNCAAYYVTLGVTQFLARFGGSHE